MYFGDLIDIDESCRLLGISRATLTIYRKKYSPSSFRIKRSVYLSKTDLLYKIFAVINPLSTMVSLTINQSASFDEFRIDATTYDLRRVNIPDGHGAISLLAHLLDELRSGKYLHLLIDEKNTFLKAMNFFGELKRYRADNKIFWDDDIYESIKDIDYNSLIRLPIKRIGYVGAQSSFVDDLILQLARQGYSHDICSYIGWALGELADNSATHAKSHPCFVYFEQFGESKSYLQLTIGDIGVGIPSSLKNNPKYQSLEDKSALLHAFKPYVSGRLDEEKRGKGLTDVLQIVMGCSSRMRVESNGIGYSFNFDSGVDNFEPVSPLYHGSGTIISLLLIDGVFGQVSREDVNLYIENCLRKI